ncbi:MAG: hypothetical protein KKB50_03990 [Planctomycetes bacterium]|nr:hypothetical protein [Planctomycetota bacterium]
MNQLLTPILEYERPSQGSANKRWQRRLGVRIDLHCHSTASHERIRWVPGLLYHPLLKPGELYDLAKSRGMDFVTITDHDTIDGCRALLDERGDLPDFIVGEEVSVAFPEDGTVVHVNVYDIDETQHDEIQRLAGNIYELIGYLRQIDKLFILNHMTWTRQHRVLRPPQIEALLALFPVFEGLNGARSYAHNACTWAATGGHDKVLVAGSDSHTHRVGTTYTVSAGHSKAELLANVRAGNAAMCGSFGTPEKLREDVWITLHKNVERRVTETSSWWYRLTCHVVERIGNAVYPVVCLGYHTRQNVLIRGFNQALAT